VRAARRFTGVGSRVTASAAALALSVLGLAACQSARSEPVAATKTAPSDGTGTTASQPADTSSSAAATSSTSGHPSTTAKPQPVGLGPGARGPEIQALEQKLDQLHYTVGAVDDRFDSLTTEGVIAFQKVNNLPRTGRVTPEVEAAVAAASLPAPMIPDGGPTRVEVDLKRQVLFFYENGSLSKTVMISSGGGYRYCVKGACSKAITPGGSFKAGVKILGKHVAPLGVLYNPVFFNGGIAIHGEPAVPTYPASHGCVRVPMSISRYLFDHIAKGTPIYVFGGPTAPVPFNTPAPDGTPPQGPVDVPTPEATTSSSAATTSTTGTTSSTGTTSTTAKPTTTSSSSTTTSSSTTSTTATP
jgi:lipoprotein-anchoring transpeptidase ErfK/SrfK